MSKTTKQKNDRRRGDWIQAAQEVYRHKAASRERVKKKLNSYVDMKKESEWLQRALHRLEAEQMECARVLGEAIAPCSSLQARYRRSLQEISAAIEEIEQRISSLSPIERRLIQCRYMDGLTWEEVGREIGYEWSQTHRLHNAILCKLAAE